MIGAGNYVIATPSELGNCMSADTGDAAGARDQFAALLAVIERIYDAEHRYVVGTRANLAEWTRLASAQS